MAEQKIQTSKSVKIATVLRVKDEEKYIRRALDSLLALDGPIIVLDDGSTDKTGEIVESFPDVRYHRQDEEKMDEGRDRTHLFNEALETDADWVFTLDGDEELDNNTAERMLRAVERCPDNVNVFGMYMAVMASPPDAVRPRRYGGGPPSGFWTMDRMFRVRDADTKHKFKSKFKNNLHCGCVPKMRDRNSQRLNAWIRYYGYESEEAVEAKRMFYKKHDPKNFPNTERMWAERAKQGTIVWQANPSCNEMSITGTVTY